MTQQQTLPQGTILRGQAYSYRIERVLGQGSLGITYLASIQSAGQLGKLDLKAQVAIKEFFMRDINGREGTTVTSGSRQGLYGEYKRKFVREARNLSQLEHPNIIKVLEAFETNNTVYYAMEYIDGGSLDSLIASRGRLSEAMAITITRQIGRALQKMHSEKMLHLDLKPGNVMMKQGEAVLIDFGLSKQFDANGQPESSTTIGGGTPGYAPIEQTNYQPGEGFPATMDVYALGATLFKMVTGQRAPIASEIFNEGFPSGELRGINRQLAAVIEKAMAPRRKDRYQSVAEMMAALPVGGSNELTEVRVEVEPATWLLPVRSDTDRIVISSTGTTIGSHHNVFDDFSFEITPKAINGKQIKHSDFNSFVRKLSALRLQLTNAKPFYPREYSETPGNISIILYAGGQPYATASLTAFNTDRCGGNIIGQNIIELRSRLRTMCDSLLPKETTPVLKPKETTPVFPPDIDPPKPKRRSKFLYILLALVAIVGGIAAFAIWGTGSTQTAEDWGDTIVAYESIDSIVPIMAYDSSGVIDGHEYVDLGLPSGLMWARCNIGADSPEEYGDYFAWGVTEFKVNYKDNRATLNKTIQEFAGDSKYDAATANWGGRWRMPKEEDFDELEEKCYYEWIGNGAVFTSQINGAKLYLPASGNRLMLVPSQRGSHGFYWSASPSSNTEKARSLYFDSKYAREGSFNREFCFSVRPVAK